MAAGMHLAVGLRAVRELVHLLHRQAVHIGPQPDRAQRVAAPDRADDAGLGEAPMHLAAIFGELLRDQITGPLLGEAELGMGMDVAADLGQLVEIVEGLGDDWHDGSGGGVARPARVWPAAGWGQADWASAGSAAETVALRLSNSRWRSLRRSILGGSPRFPRKCDCPENRCARLFAHQGYQTSHQAA